MRTIMCLLIMSMVAADFSDFKVFVETYNKTYKGDEIFTRYEIFENNLALIEEHNAQDLGWTLGVNQFADLTAQEFSAMYLTLQPNPDHGQDLQMWNLEQATATATAPATEVDWSAKPGMVTPVKSQGQCGACWSFSSTGSIESANAIAGNGLISLSEQQLMDCSGSFGNHNCQGGWMTGAFKWVMHNGGITAEVLNPYLGKAGTCSRHVSVAKITNYVEIPPKNETALKVAVTKQPVSIAVDASKWQLYSSGIFRGCSPNVQLDHGVLVTGFSDSQKFWKVKNSWDTTWGLQGYILLALGINECGLSNAASYPLAPPKI
jgi:C1A family cysteine protease